MGWGIEVSAPMSKRPAVYFVLLVTVIDAIGIGLIMPVMPALLSDLDGGTLAEAAAWGGLLAAIFAGMQFLFGPLVGNLSDRFGRRRVLLVSLSVMAVDYVLMGLAHAMWLLIVARILGGITARNSPPSPPASIHPPSPPPPSNGSPP